MTQLFGLLSIGAGALLAQQRAISVTGNNIANVNTPGYSRQRLNMETNLPVDSPVGPAGFGVQTTTVERVYDRFLGVQMNNENANLGRWEAQKGMLEKVEVVFDESDGYGLNQALSDFWSSWQDLSMNPSGTTERSVVAANSQALADTIRQKYADLGQTQDEIDAAVKSGVEDINRLTAEIADLNQKIADTEAGGTVNANDYRDRRDLALKELSEIIGINSFEDADGRVVVSVGSGRVLVESGNNYALATATNAEGHENIVWPDITGAPLNISSEIASGKMAGWLQTRDTKIEGYKSSLDDLAQTLATEVNTLHAAGYGLNGSHGDNLFSGSGAADMAVNPTVLNDLNRIAAASAASTVPGDASNAAAVADLRTSLTMSGGTATFDDATNALVSLVGHDVQEAETYQSHQADMMTYLDNYRESVSGVNLDEEMVNLVKYQAAYNAAAKMISMGDDMLNSLMNMIR
ncbi:MAG: flagellar hook-associated protein FlgK [Deltaproteobacteria bacterium]|nr:flagellar hook-associated protein FlgK [Deltaproteobacteria bacterium]